MKKPALFLSLLCLCLLTACGQDRVHGKVAEYGFAEDGVLSSFVLDTENGKRMGVLLDAGSRVVCWADGFTQEDFTSGSLGGVEVTVDCKGSSRKLTDGDGASLRARTAKTVYIDWVQTKNARTLSDGTSVDIWTGSRATSYRLADGTELLYEQHCTGPENVYVGNSESYDDLGAAAQEAISAFYEEQGLLYDAAAELENSYQAYLAREDKPEYNGCTVGQEIAPISSTERLMSFLTTVTLPVGEQLCTELRLCATFDRTTGERLDPMDLFTCEETTVLETLLDCSGLDDPALRAEMASAFDPAYLEFFPDSLQLCFPQGSLPSQAYSHYLSADYSGLRGILRDWAVPEGDSAPLTGGEKVHSRAQAE